MTKKEEVMECACGIINKMERLIDALVDARESGDKRAEYKASLEFELCFVEAQQQLLFLVDYIDENVAD